MYSESFTVSEFASRLAKISLSSFNDILYLVQEYEVLLFLIQNLHNSLFVNCVEMKLILFLLILLKSVNNKNMSL